MVRRLNGWQRIAVALSIFWLLLVGGRGAWEFFYPSDYPVAHLFGDWYTVAVAMPTEPAAGKLITLEEARGFRVVHRFAVGRLLAVMFVPIGALWATVFVVQWIVAGFRNPDP